MFDRYIVGVIAGRFPVLSNRYALNEMAAYEKAIIILQMNGADRRFAYPLFQKYNTSCDSILQHNPYVPYLEGAYDFQTADKLFLKQGNLPGDPKRCRAAIQVMLLSELDKYGNLFVRKDCLKGKLLEFLQADESPFTDETLGESVDWLAKRRDIVLEKTLGGESIYLHSSYQDEQIAAEEIWRIWLGAKRINVSPDEIKENFS